MIKKPGERDCNRKPENVPQKCACSRVAIQLVQSATSPPISRNANGSKPIIPLRKYSKIAFAPTHTKSVAQNSIPQTSMT